MKKLASGSILALLLATLAACSPASQSNSVLGEGQDNIIGGTTVVPGSPLARQVFMIYVLTARSGGICTATMITDVIGLTAAHCVDEARAGFALFEIDAIRKLENAGSRQQLLKSPRVIPMTSIRVHPAWTGSISRGNNGDIAIFKLARPRPSDIEITQIHTEPIRAGQTIVASGYGNNSGSLQMGSGLLRETRVRVLETKVTETEFAVDQKQARGVCSGDSGGPAFVVSPFGRLRQVGIVSYGEEGCENYGVYTYVAPFLPWIQQTIPTMK